MPVSDIIGASDLYVWRESQKAVYRQSPWSYTLSVVIQNRPTWSYGREMGGHIGQNGIPVSHAKWDIYADFCFQISSLEEVLAERGRFELPVAFQLRPLSRRVHSTTLPPLRCWCLFSLTVTLSTWQFWLAALRQAAFPGSAAIPKATPARQIRIH
jgi:hypothetical protein